MFIYKPFLLSEITSLSNIEPFRQNYAVQKDCFVQEDMIRYTGHTEDADQLRLPVAFKSTHTTHPPTHTILSTITYASYALSIRR